MGALKSVSSHKMTRAMQYGNLDILGNGNRR